MTLNIFFPTDDTPMNISAMSIITHSPPFYRAFLTVLELTFSNFQPSTKLLILWLVFSSFLSIVFCIHSVEVCWLLPLCYSSGTWYHDLLPRLWSQVLTDLLAFRQSVSDRQPERTSRTINPIMFIQPKIFRCTSLGLKVSFLSTSTTSTAPCLIYSL